ncbi:MAG: hypothetical protein HDR41_04125 [Lactobacillus sp.]|nr:hypothetical protein [Lactobacillus sp.]
MDKLALKNAIDTNNARISVLDDKIRNEYKILAREANEAAEKEKIIDYDTSSLFELIRQIEIDKAHLAELKKTTGLIDLQTFLES